MTPNKAIVISRVVNGIPFQVRTSKNLRGVMEHTRKVGKPEAVILPLPNGKALVSLKWPNNDTASVPFESLEVAKAWFGKRAASVIL